MAKYLCRLTKREEIAKGTLAVRLERPPEFQFRPGQYASLTLLDPPETDEEGNTRTFSMASAPAEDRLVFATRIRGSAFKRVLSRLEPGTTLRLSGPAGAFTLHADPATPAVFLAGGIGITPFMSMIAQAAHEGSARPITLFYANRRAEEAAFLDALEDTAGRLPGFLFVPTLTDTAVLDASWRAETGRINGAMLARHLPALRRPMYYVAGPASMVEAMQAVLTAAGVTEDRIRSEEFPGY
jgi:ferredoxin-NADP reductase